MSFKILIGCECSQTILKAFVELGFDAYSCDLQPCRGDYPERHIQADVFDVIASEKWKLGIFHPPCDHLAVSGTRHFKQKIADGRQQAGIDFFMRFTDLDIPHVCIENPVGIMSSHYRKPDQAINPWQFGDEFQKKTCLWLKDLPKLVHIKEPDLFNKRATHVGRGEFIVTEGGNRIPKWYSDARSDRKTQKYVRSKTFPGIAKAMAEQWSIFLK